MDEEREAAKIALQTLKERCSELQMHLDAVETENRELKRKVGSNETDVTQNDVSGSLAALTEENAQLQRAMELITGENKRLWSRLSSFAIEKHTKPLIRSKTFTQNEPQTKHLQRTLSENNKLSLELENISLKLMNSYSKEKEELEAQVAEMNELTKHELLSDSYGFNYIEDETDDEMVDELELHVNRLKEIKQHLHAHKEKLLSNMNRLLERMETEEAKTKLAKEPEVPKEDLEVTLELESLKQWASTPAPDVSRQQICPMCSNNFGCEVSFMEFASHVQSHFTNL